MRKQEIIINGWGEFWELLPKKHQEYALANNGFVCIGIGGVEINESIDVWMKYYSVNSEMTSCSYINLKRQLCALVMPGIIYKQLKKYYPNDNIKYNNEFKN